MLLDRIRMCNTYRTLPEGLEIEFKHPITLLVGDNGAGKSTLLEAIRSNYGVTGQSYLQLGTDAKEHIEVFGDATPDDVLFFDFHASDQKYNNTFGEDILGQLSAMRSSSGESTLTQFVRAGIPNARDSLIILDEIGRGLSIKTQHMLGAGLIKMTGVGNQIIAVTHSTELLTTLPHLDNLCGVYSVEHQKYMSGEEYRKLQRVAAYEAMGL